MKEEFEGWQYIKAIVAYKGTFYKGWQSQKHKKTVQDQIELSLYRIFNKKQTILGASRTDSGVHAEGQVFTFYAPLKVSLDKLIEILNSSLPEDILIQEVSLCDNSFHPRYSAKKKVYSYHISQIRKLPLFSDSFYFYQKKINLDLLEEALCAFVGTHDFKLISQPFSGQNTIRTIYSIEIEKNEDDFVVNIIGSGFLRYMIRKIIWIALFVEKKNISVLYIKDLLKGIAKKNNIGKIPAKGLVLKKVIY